MADRLLLSVGVSDLTISVLSELVARSPLAARDRVNSSFVVTS